MSRATIILRDQQGGGMTAELQYQHPHNATSPANQYGQRLMRILDEILAASSAPGAAEEDHRVT